MSLSLRYAARSDVGLAREGNEDAMYAGPRLLAVADGMGGHAAGEVASRVVIETIAPLDAGSADPATDGDLTGDLRSAVETANGYLRDMVAADGALEGMGTTLTALLWVGQQLGLVHIGDSRAYLLRDRRLHQVTHDHTLVQSLIDQGRITPDEANTHPQRSWITNALDGRPDIELDVSIRDVQPGDRYLVCSDGLSSYVSEQTIEEALGSGDPQTSCDLLVDLALRAGGLDNVTCIVADLVEDAGQDGGPIVGGAAAQAPHERSHPHDHPAARAAAARAAGRNAGAPAPTIDAGGRASSSSDSPDDGDDGEQGSGTARPDTGRTSRRVVFVLVAVLVLVVAGGLATFLYVRTQFYVGVAQGSPATVGVYRGVDGQVLGLDLSRLSRRTDLPVSALSSFERDRVSSSIQADGETDADRIVTTLRSTACASATPSPQPAATASGRKGHRATPSPSPSPAPAYCQTSP